MVKSQSMFLMPCGLVMVMMVLMMVMMVVIEVVLRSVRRQRNNAGV